MITKNRIAFFQMAMAIASMGSGIKHHVIENNGNPEKIFIDKPKDDFKPSGTEWYFFTSYGEILTPPIRKDSIYFKCYAINKKSAINKYQKFKAKEANNV